MIIYYSGNAGVKWTEPEALLGDSANIMLSYHFIEISKIIQTKRFTDILAKRRQKAVSPHDRHSDVGRTPS